MDIIQVSHKEIIKYKSRSRERERNEMKKDVFLYTIYERVLERKEKAKLLRKPFLKGRNFDERERERVSSGMDLLHFPQ